MVSSLDTWFYTNAASPGDRSLGPTFLGGVVVNGSQQFAPLTHDDPSRLGAPLFAFNTSPHIEAGHSAERYQINAVTFTATFTYDFDPKKLQYTHDPITHQQILSEYVNGPVTRRRPMELYGVGFRAGYTGFEFAAPPAVPELLDEVTHPYSAPDGGYIAYPIVREAASGGGFANVDVMNSVTGGFSATAPGNTTAAFTPTPWSIGRAYLPQVNPNDPLVEYAEGADLPDFTTFTFNVDLNATGVRSYIQDALSKGELGFFVSSLHSTGTMGTGGGYPRWLTKESAGFPYNADPHELPRLMVDYSILPEGVPGDYNGNGQVDAADYVLWRKGGPLLNQVHDRDHVNEQDYVEWRARFGNPAGVGSGLGRGAATPEPNGAWLLVIAMSTSGVFTKRKRT
jgi:hypothetical protein